MDIEFSRLAEAVLSLIVDTIEVQDQDGDLEIDFQGDIITITAETGVFVINKHSAAREIWLASPISGPHHFAYLEGGWRSKAGNELFDVLSKELNIDFATS